MRKVISYAVVVAVAMVLPATASAQFDLSRALGAFFGAITKTEQKSEQTEQKAEGEQTKADTKPQTKQPQQNPFEMLQQLQQTQQGQWAACHLHDLPEAKNPLARSLPTMA